MEDVFATAEQSHLSARHRASACNALCALLDQGYSSSVPELQSLCCSDNIWCRMLDIYLARFQDPTAKPMKRILNMLVKLLSQESNGTRRHSDDSTASLVEKASHKCLSSICTYGCLSPVKPSMIMLEILISKKKLTPVSLLSTFSSLQAADERAQSQSIPLKLHVRSFARCVLRLTHHADISSLAGRFLTTFFTSLHSASAEARLETSALDDPLWVTPILEFAFDNDASLQVAESYVLPDLLRADPVATMKFLQRLPLESILRGRLSAVSDRDVRFSMLITRVVGEGHPLVDESRCASLMTKMTMG